jgi:hypothetical protein
VTLVDTSVWVLAFQRRAPLDLDSVVPIEDVATCLPVIQEILQGFRDPRAFRIARDSLLNFPIVESPLRLECVDVAVEFYRRARAVGLSVRSSVDCLIAACAIRNDLEVLHRDRDYPLLARVSGLRQRAV